MTKKMKNPRHHSVYKNFDFPNSLSEYDSVEFARMFKNEFRKNFEHVHYEGKKRLATDEFRYHCEIMDTEYSSCPVCDENNFQYPDTNIFYSKRYETKILVDAANLRKFVLAIRKASRLENDIIVLSNLEKGFLQIADQSGTSYGKLDAKHNGNELYIGANFKFVVDAIDHCSQGKGNVRLLFNKNNMPFLVESEDGKRQAIIMPMNV